MTEQLNTKPLLKILKNILKYGLKNKNDSKQLLETVNCVMSFGLDSMIKDYTEKGKNGELDDVVYIKKEKKEPEIIDIYDEAVVVKEELKDFVLGNDKDSQIDELRTMIQSNHSFMKEQTQMIDRLVHMMDEFSKRMNKLEDEKIVNEKSKENITLEIRELETSVKMVEIKNQIVEKETNQFVKEAKEQDEVEEESEEEESEEEESEEEESEEEESEEKKEEEEEEAEEEEDEESEEEEQDEVEKKEEKAEEEEQD